MYIYSRVEYSSSYLFLDDSNCLLAIENPPPIKKEGLIKKGHSDEMERENVALNKPTSGTPPYGEPDQLL